VYLVSASLVVHKNERGKGNKEKSGGETSLKICITLLMEEKYLVSELLVVHTKKGGKGKKKKKPPRKAAYAPHGGAVSRECVARRLRVVFEPVLRSV